jgi:hypothetical protein
MDCFLEIPMVPSWYGTSMSPARIYDEENSLPLARNTPVFIGFISPCLRQGFSLLRTGIFTVTGEEIHCYGNKNHGFRKL